MTLLSDLKVAIIVEEGVNQHELGGPREQLEKAGLKVDIISPHMPEVKAWSENNWGIRIKVDKQIPNISPEDYQGIIIPGGPLHSDELRMNPFVLDFINQFFSAGKTVAAISHGIQVLISADILEGRQVTGCASLRTDINLSGGLWADQDVVSDNGLITCRSEQDIEKFSKVFLEDLRHGVHQRTETII
jgi:protease I